MSTYGVIARKTATGFIGRLHQNVGNPHLLGRALFRLRNGYFQGDTASMLRILVDEHPAGWSDITGKDFALAPGFVLPPPYLLWIVELHRSSCGGILEHIAFHTSRRAVYLDLIPGQICLPYLGRAYA